MQSIYDAAHIADAHLVRNLLASHGIPAHVAGEYLQGGMGELPLGNLLQVRVADSDAARARGIVEDWQQASVENNPLLDDEVDGEPSDGPAATGPGTAKATTSSRFGLGLLVGAAAAAVVTWAVMRVPAPGPADYNNDGRIDEAWVAVGGGRMSRESDRNTDGRVDEVFVIERSGLPVMASNDDDFDGRMETRTRYRHGLWTSLYTDYDGDGQTDLRLDAHHGVAVREEWLDARQNVVKRVHYEGGRAVRGELDTDGDGTLDRRLDYDERGEPRAAQD